MINNKKLMALLITTSLTPAIRAADLFDWDMDSFWDKQIKFMEEVRDTMHKTQEAMKTAFNTKNTISLKINEDNQDNVIIAVKGITADTFDASINSDKDLLSIATPTENIKIYVDHLSRDREFISVEIAQDIRSEQTSEAKEKNEKEQTQAVYSSSRMRSGHTIEGSINLDAVLDNPTQAITYDKKEELLTIFLPKTSAKKSGHVIPVTIVNQEAQIEK